MKTPTGITVVFTVYRVFTKGWYSFKNLLNDYILQLDAAAPAPFHRNVQQLLNRFLQQRWIRRAANGDNNIQYGTNSIIVWMCVV
jgi:hypothetical protein